VQVGVKAGNPEGEPPFAAFDADRVVQTASGLRYEELRPGAGASPGPRSKVEVHYVGWTLDGTRFDSSFARRQSAEFPLGGVIRGWTEGIQLMRPGAVFRFEIPAALAYGQRGAGTVIKPGATLVFWVQLISFTG
jgi:FKBP-type peptidyl-prolyl cis-trans isomerase